MLYIYCDWFEGWSGNSTQIQRHVSSTTSLAESNADPLTQAKVKVVVRLSSVPHEENGVCFNKKGNFYKL